MLAVTAVLGDGYFEIAKHVWLAAYLVDTTAALLVATAVAVTLDLVRSHGVQPGPAAA
ncbi:hypothetical protein ACFQV8_08345 [Pseudonocardia benzenivorans]